MKYHYADAKNDAIGPVEESELDELFKTGVISRETNVLPEGSESWLPYAKARNLVTLPPSNPLSPSTQTPAPQASQSQHSVAGTKHCPYCDEQVSMSAKKCKHCGEILDVALRAVEEVKKSAHLRQQPQQPMVFMNAGGGGGGSSSAANAIGGGGYGAGQIVGTKSRVVAAVLAFFFGGLGIHKFYLGQLAWGVIYVVFCWTFIPVFLGWIEGLLYLLSTERAFALKYG